MANSFSFFDDPVLTAPAANPLVISQNRDGSTGDVDGVMYYGSTASGTTAQADSDPGVDQIIVSILDSAGGGPDVTDVKLASSNANLDAATAGDPLNLGLTVSSGVGNQVAVHYRIKTPTVGTAGTYNELSLETNATREL